MEIKWEDLEQNEKQVCSPEPSKRLKELNVKQESLYYHWQDVATEEYMGVHDFRSVEMECFSAFTVAELGEMLPHEMVDEHQDLPYFLTCEKCEESDYWMVCYRGDRGVLSGLREEARTEADARAKMLIFLFENKLIINE